MSDASKYSEELDPVICQPCSLDGKSKAAHGFCDTCKEHLCVSCFKGHRLPMVCRDHVMLDKISMPKEKVIARDPLTAKCEVHSHLLEYYCKKHKAILCSVCVTLNHKECGMSFIPNISEDVGNSREFSCLLDNLLALIERVKRNKETISGNLINIEMLKIDTRSQVRQLKEDYIRLFDELELSLVRKIDLIVETDISRMNEISESCVAMETDLQKLAKDLDEKSNRNQNNKLFVAMKEAEKKMAEFQPEIESVNSKIGITRHWFEADLVQMERVKSSVKTLGKVYVRRHDNKVKATYVRDINVRSKADIKTCFITGLATISSDRIVVCDYENGADGNNSLKLVDIIKNKVISQIGLPSIPWDTALMTRKSSTQDLIVTMPGVKRLHIVNVIVDQLMDTDTDIPVDGRCRGIQVTRGRTVVVSYDEPAKIEILAMDGTVLRKITSEHGDDALFWYPRYVAVSPCSKWIYVTSYGNNRLTSVRDRDGSMMVEFKGMKEPRGVTVDRAGTVFVCCGSRSIQQLTASGDRSTQILGRENGLCRYPQAIAVSPVDDRMFVSGNWSDRVQEFQLGESDK